MSDTPRTDEKAGFAGYDGDFENEPSEVVPADFARDQERELAQAHAILDNDPSKIIRNAKDGYPEGREPRELTLAERVAAICRYASDYSRWCKEAEQERDLLRAKLERLESEHASRERIEARD